MWVHLVSTEGKGALSPNPRLKQRASSRKGGGEGAWREQDLPEDPSCSLLGPLRFTRPQMVHLQDPN